jgi:hypothetical protein
MMSARPLICFLMSVAPGRTKTRASLTSRPITSGPPELTAHHACAPGPSQATAAADSVVAQQAQSANAVRGPPLPRDQLRPTVSLTFWVSSGRTPNSPRCPSTACAADNTPLASDRCRATAQRGGSRTLGRVSFRPSPRRDCHSSGPYLTGGVWRTLTILSAGTKDPKPPLTDKLFWAMNLE